MVLKSILGIVLMVFIVVSAIWLHIRRKNK